MQGDDLLLGQTRVPGHKGQVGAKLAAIADRDRDKLAVLGGAVRIRDIGQLLHGGGHGIIVGHQWVVGDHQRGKGGHGLVHAGDVGGQNAGVQRRHGRADLRRNALRKNCQQGAVPHRVYRKRQHGRRPLSAKSIKEMLCQHRAEPVIRVVGEPHRVGRALAHQTDDAHVHPGAETVDAR